MTKLNFDGLAADSEDIPYGATHTCKNKGITEYLWISADGYIFMWSSVEAQWYFFSRENRYEIFDQVASIDEPTITWDGENND